MLLTNSMCVSTYISLSSEGFEVSLNSSEQLEEGVGPHLSLVLVTDMSQRLGDVHQRQHRPLKVLPAQSLAPLGELGRQTPDVREAFREYILTDDFQLFNTSQGGQLLIWDQQGVFITLDLHSGQQNLGGSEASTKTLV